jgi:hypothetical protein
MCVYPSEGTFLVETYQAAVTDDIRRENSREPPLPALFGSRWKI